MEGVLARSFTTTAKVVWMGEDSLKQLVTTFFWFFLVFNLNQAVVLSKLKPPLKFNFLDPLLACMISGKKW